MKTSRPLQWLLVLTAAGLVSCAGSSITRRTNTDETGHPEAISSTETRIFVNKDEAALDKARQDRRQGHYAEATTGFQSVYDNVDAKPEFREQALFELARINADLLNPRKDREKAIALFESFLAEYPQSKLAAEAREQLNALRTTTP